MLLKLRQQGLDEIENNAPNLVKNNDLKSKLTDKSDGANGNWIKFGRLCGCCKKWVSEWVRWVIISEMYL